MTTITRKEVFDRIAALESRIRELGISRLALFGSVIRDEAGPDSDVDVLVQFLPGAKTYDRFITVSEILETALERHVEIITTEALSSFLGPHILREAQDVLRAA